MLAGLVGFAAGLYAIQSGAERLKIYLMLLLIMQGGLMGVFASVDVFFFYFFHELALIPTFIMVGVWGGRDRSYAAMKLTIYLTLGAMISLVGLIALYVKSGAHTFDLIALRATSPRIRSRRRRRTTSSACSCSASASSSRSGRCTPGRRSATAPRRVPPRCSTPAC